MATDGYVQVPPDQSGKKIDTAELTRADASVVERQRVEIPDTIKIDSEMERLILIELRVQNVLLAQAFGITDDLDSLRNSLTI